MGLLDDLQMGFGLKERDDDYYERTAATIGRQQGAGAEERYRGSNVFQEKPEFGGPFSFFGRGGEGGGITGPRDFVDGGGLGRSGDTFVGGPVSILANLLGIRPMGYNDRDRVGQRAGMGAFGSGVLRPTQSVIGAIPIGNGQPETRFDTRTEAEPIDYSDGIPVQDPATIAATEALKDLSYLPEPDIDVDFSDFPASNSAFEAFIPSATTTPSYIPALQSMAGTPELDINFLENTRVPRAIDLERPLPVMPKDPTYYSGIDVDVPAIPTPDVVQLPNGLYFSRSTGKVFR